MKHEPILVSMEEGAAMLGLCRATVYKLVSEGKVRSVHYGKRRLLPVDGLRQFAASLPHGRPTPAS